MQTRERKERNNGVSRKERQESDQKWRVAIGQRVRQLRNAAGLTLEEVAARTGDLMSKSQISNYEQFFRMPGPAEATMLARVFRTSAAHILCIDDSDQPMLSVDEAKLVRDLRTLPEALRYQYIDRIHLLAQAYKKPIAGDHPSASKRLRQKAAPLLLPKPPPK